MLSLAKAPQWNFKVLSSILRYTSIYHKNAAISRNVVDFCENRRLLKQGLWNRNCSFKKNSRSLPKLCTFFFDKRHYDNPPRLQTLSTNIDTLKKTLLSNLKDLLQSFLTSPCTSHMGFSFERHASLHTSPLLIKTSLIKNRTVLKLMVLFPLHTKLNCIDSKSTKKKVNQAYKLPSSNWTIQKFDATEIQCCGLFENVSSWEILSLQEAIRETVKLFSKYTNLPISILCEDTNTLTRYDTELKISESCKNALYSSLDSPIHTIWKIPVFPSIHGWIRSSRQLPADYEETMKLFDEFRHTKSFNSPFHYFLLPPHRSIKSMITFPIQFFLNYRFYMIFMARTIFQALRPLLAFCVFGEIMKLSVAVMNSGLFYFFFSFILAFEVLYFFLQSYISYVFLGMFFASAF